MRRARDISGGPTFPYDPVIIDHSISPNGRRLATTLWLTTRTATPEPGEPTGTDYSTTVWYTQAKNGKLLPGTTDGGQSATWVTNSLPVVFAPYGEVTRRQDKVAVVRGPNTVASSGQTMIRVYSVASMTTRPTERCDLRAAPNSRIESPSWSPDGRRLVWSEADGIWVSPIADGTGDCGAAPKLLIRGGSQPDWGSANR